MAHHFVLLLLNLFDLRVDREGWWFEHSVSFDLILPVSYPIVTVMICYTKHDNPYYESV